jgi:hypothetical protein
LTLQKLLPIEYFSFFSSITSPISSIDCTIASASSQILRALLQLLNITPVIFHESKEASLATDVIFTFQSHFFEATADH